MTSPTLEKLVQKLSRTISRTSIEYELLAPGDKILVAVSGGKDSYGLLYLLEQIRRKLPFKVELIALHVAQGQPGVNPAPLVAWLEESGIPFEVANEDTYTVVQNNIQPGQTACSICSRMRRGILYTHAEKHGCNKLALGHHRDDTLATLLMNLFYTGRIQAMPASYRTDDDRFDVIRPMIEVAEEDLVTLSELLEFPIVPCYLCSGQEDHKRRRMGELMDLIEEEGHPGLRQVMLGALKNVRPTHLLDKTIERKKETR